MPNAVCMGAMLKCFLRCCAGLADGLPTNLVMGPQPVANIMDGKADGEHPAVRNVSINGQSDGGGCHSSSDGRADANTVHSQYAPWVVGAPTVMLGNMPILNNSAKLMCLWAGVLKFCRRAFPTVITP